VEGIETEFGMDVERNLPLPQRADRWRWLLEESPAAMLVTDGETVLFANRAAARVLGYDHPEQLAGKTMWDLNVPEDHELVRERIRRLRGRQHSPVRDARLRCADGQVKQVEVAGYPIDYEGRDAVFVRLTDVTAQRGREAAERETRERLSLAIDMIGGATWVYDYATGEVRDCDGLMRLLGYEPQEVLPAANIMDLVHPDDRHRVAGRLSLRAREGGPEVSSEHRLRRADGAYVWVRSRARIVADETGRPLRALGIDTDITTEKRDRILREGRAAALSAITAGAPLESVLRQVALTAQQAIDGCIAGVLRAENGRLGLVSGPDLPAPLAEHLSSVPVGDGGGCPGRAAAGVCRVVNDGIGDAGHTTEIALALSAAGVRAAWMEPIVSVLGRVLGVLAIYMPQASGPRLTDEVVLRELSDVARLAIEHARTQAHLREARAEAERANRAKSHFLATMSHELRTPLNAVIGFAEVMQHGVFGPIGNPRYEAYARDIVTSARHLLDILSDILDMSRIEAGRWEIGLEPVGRAEVGGVAHLLSAVAGQHGCPLQLEVADDFRALADLRALKQILINLTSNAARYGRAGAPILIRGTMTDGAAVLEVCDEGLGIPAEEIETLLQPFERSESAKASVQGGIGLGLPIVRQLAELQGARFELLSEPGIGTTARVAFQPAEPAGAAAARRPAATCAPAGHEA
jgi:two-component system cell cycle sensor histidine kinase PleC